jgi:hypothetical protein
MFQVTFKIFERNDVYEKNRKKTNVTCKIRTRPILDLRGQKKGRLTKIWCNLLIPNLTEIRYVIS